MVVEDGPVGAPACDVLHVRRRAEVDRGHDLDVGGLVASCMVAKLVLAARVPKLPEARVWGWSSGVGVRRGRGRGRNRRVRVTRDAHSPTNAGEACRRCRGSVISMVEQWRSPEVNDGDRRLGNAARGVGVR